MKRAKGEAIVTRREKETEVELGDRRYLHVGGKWYVWAAPCGRSTSTEYRWCVVPHTAYKLFAELAAAVEKAA